MKVGSAEFWDLKTPFPQNFRNVGLIEQANKAHELDHVWGIY